LREEESFVLNDLSRITIENEIGRGERETKQKKETLHST